MSFSKTFIPIKYLFEERENHVGNKLEARNPGGPSVIAVRLGRIYFPFLFLFFFRESLVFQQKLKTVLTLYRHVAVWSVALFWSFVRGFLLVVSSTLQPLLLSTLSAELSSFLVKTFISFSFFFFLFWATWWPGTREISNYN